MKCCCSFFPQKRVYACFGGAVSECLPREYVAKTTVIVDCILYLFTEHLTVFPRWRKDWETFWRVDVSSSPTEQQHRTLLGIVGLASKTLGSKNSIQTPFGFRWEWSKYWRWSKSTDQRSSSKQKAGWCDPNRSVPVGMWLSTTQSRRVPLGWGHLPLLTVPDDGSSKTQKKQPKEDVFVFKKCLVLPGSENFWVMFGWF